MDKNNNAFSQESIDTTIFVEDFNFNFSPDFILSIIYDENQKFSEFSEKYKSHPSIIKIEELCDEYDGNNLYEIFFKIDKELLKLKEEDASCSDLFVFQ